MLNERRRIRKRKRWTSWTSSPFWAAVKAGFSTYRRAHFRYGPPFIQLIGNSRERLSRNINTGRASRIGIRVCISVRAAHDFPCKPWLLLGFRIFVAFDPYRAVNSKNLEETLWICPHVSRYPVVLGIAGGCGLGQPYGQHRYEPLSLEYCRIRDWTQLKR